MAERRMFAKSVIMCDAFLCMTPQARCLYLSLCMAADDDGLVDSYRAVSYGCGAKPKHLQELQDHNYVKLFPSGVLGIIHWQVNNQIRKDRYRESRYEAERDLLTPLQEAVLTPKKTTKTATKTDAHSAPVPATQDREGESNLVKNNLVEFSEDKIRQVEAVPDVSSCQSSGHPSDISIDPLESQIMELYRELCPSLFPCYPGLSRETLEHIRQLVESKGMETVQQLFRAAENSAFIRGEVKADFRGSLPWLVRPDVAGRVLGGGFEPWKKEVPKGATGQLGAAELAAIQRALAEE